MQSENELRSGLGSRRNERRKSSRLCERNSNARVSSRPGCSVRKNDTRGFRGRISWKKKRSWQRKHGGASCSRYKRRDSGR